jgi:crotonobetainyl-CoA:carnitine CoA-transferase CaiB-like acyl-CoA transferase
MNLPLAGVRVIDLTRVLAGPWSAQTLADLGADVIKIERPESGDDTRSFPPFVSRDGGLGESTYFLASNRGKRSITIDLCKSDGQELVRKLLDRSDVLIENYKVGSLRKFGLDYPTIAARNPALIYCSITGFGQTGPHRLRAGYDLVIQAMSGLMSITGEPEGRPMRAGMPVADLLTALYAVIGVLAALRERQQSGLGQHIDLALLDVQIAALANPAADFLETRLVPQRYGNAHPGIVPYQDFATHDGRIVVAVANDTQFARLAAVLGMEQLSTDSKFKTNPERVRNRAILLPIISARFLAGTTSSWLAALDEKGVPAGPINSLDAVLADPQIKARDLIVELPGHAAPARVIGNPIRFSRTPVNTGRASPPKLGEHTQIILSEILGITPSEFAAFQRDGVV